MRRQFLFAAMFTAAISGCVSTDSPHETGGVRPHYGKSFGPPTVPGVEGPYGTKMPMAAPYNMAPPGSQYAAAQLMNQNIPMNLVQMNQMGGPNGGPPGAGMPNPMLPGGMLLTPPGVSGMPGMPGGMPKMPGMPGGMPGMPGGMPGGNPLMKTNLESMMPDAGIMNANIPPGVRQPGGVLPTQFSSSSPVGSMFPAQRTQVYFGNPVRMKVYWFTQGADGKPNYSTTPLETPGRYNFAQGAIYRLKLTNIPGRPGLELYPTLEVVPTSPKTNEFLAHNSVPLDFSEDDFKQVVDRNYIVKVIYLPDAQFQDAAGAGPGEITSTQLEPGQDPIQEALRRGSILMVLRIGNIDQGLISSPPTNAPIPSGPPMMMKPPGLGVPPGVQVPFNMPPITPGGAIPPGMFPPPGPGGTPPLFKVPDLPAAPSGKPLIPNKGDSSKPVIPAPGVNLEEAAKPLNIPAIPLPPPVSGPNTDKPSIPPLPIPGEKSSSAPRVEPLPAPPLSSVIPASAERPSLPAIPPLPDVPERK